LILWSPCSSFLWVFRRRSHTCCCSTHGLDARYHLCGCARHTLLHHLTHFCVGVPLPFPFPIYYWFSLDVTLPLPPPRTFTHLSSSTTTPRDNVRLLTTGRTLVTPRTTCHSVNISAAARGYHLHAAALLRLIAGLRFVLPAALCSSRTSLPPLVYPLAKRARYGTAPHTCTQPPHADTTPLPDSVGAYAPAFGSSADGPAYWFACRAPLFAANTVHREHCAPRWRAVSARLTVLAACLQARFSPYWRCLPYLARLTTYVHRANAPRCSGFGHTLTLLAVPPRRTHNVYRFLYAQPTLHCAIPCLVWLSTA